MMTVQLEPVILYLVAHAGQPLTKTSLMKMVYFADYWSVRCYGERLVECAWEQDQFGVVDYAIPDTASRLAAQGRIEVQVIQHAGAGTSWRYRAGTESVAGLTALGQREQQLLQCVLAKYRSKTAAELGQLSKRTEPWQKGAPRGTRINMNTVPVGCSLTDRPEIWLRRQRLKQADFAERGTGEERSAHALALFEEMAAARQRANVKTIPEP